MDRGAWRDTVHRVAKSHTRLKHLSTQVHMLQNMLCFCALLGFSLLSLHVGMCVHAMFVHVLPSCATLFLPQFKSICSLGPLGGDCFLPEEVGH